MSENISSELQDKLQNIINKIISTPVLERYKKIINIEEIEILSKFNGADNVGLPLKNELIDLEGFSLAGDNFSDIDLSIFYLHNCNFEGCKFTADSLSNLIAIAREQDLNLKGIVLSDEKLDRYEINNPIFGKTSFSMPYDLSKMNLENADFTNSTLKGANFKEANLKGAKLVNSNLKGANLKGARLDNADLSGAIYTIEQLSEATGVKSAILNDSKILEDIEEFNSKNIEKTGVIETIINEISKFVNISGNLSTISEFLEEILNKAKKIARKLSTYIDNRTLSEQIPDISGTKRVDLERAKVISDSNRVVSKIGNLEYLKSNNFTKEKKSDKKKDGREV